MKKKEARAIPTSPGAIVASRAGRTVRVIRAVADVPFPSYAQFRVGAPAPNHLHNSSFSMFCQAFVTLAVDKWP